MKKEIKGFICGVITTSLIGCASISATGVWDKIDVLRNDINVVVNGTPVKADNFLYNDTTYLPMRVVAEVLGKDVQYDETTNTATIKDKGDNNLSENIQSVNGYMSKYIPSKELLNDVHQPIFTNDNIYYIEPMYIYNLATKQHISTNDQDVIMNTDLDLTLGDRTWAMQRVNVG